MVAHPSVPIKTIAELIAYAKANPGKLNYSSGGVGNFSHLGLEMLAFQTGIKIVHVPYKGVGPGTTALIAGDVQLMYNNVATALPHVQAGKITGLAVGTSRAPAGAAERSDRRRNRAGLQRDAVGRAVRAGQVAERDRGAAEQGDRRGAEGPGGRQELRRSDHQGGVSGFAGVHPGNPEGNRCLGQGDQDARHQGGLGRTTAMYSLHLSAEQLEFRDTVRGFVDDVVKPVVLKADRLDAGDRGAADGRARPRPRRWGCARSRWPRSWAASAPTR